ncbi:MAG: UDP-N-acetylmuramoyl-tripeptide--D-alanyl-D-alanine ligase [Planctomycetales bacterium]
MEPVLLNDVLAATRGTATGLGANPPPITRVSTDSRQVRAGDLFWALPGARFDGHDFVTQALNQGAAACVVERSRAAQLTGPILQVDDSLRALGDLARWYRHQREAMVIGVTGSVGKTTTREMVHAVLSSSHSGMRSQRNYNNEIGLPMSLLELAADHDFAVLEMGAGRVGDIRALCEIACPEIGIVTRIGPAHLESFGGLDQIYQGKGELLEALPTDGFAVVGGDDDRMRDMARRAACQVFLVGEAPGNQVRATQVEFKPGQLRFLVERRKYELAVPARHYLTAALCALAVAREIGMDASAIAEGFRNFSGMPQRCQVEQVGEWTLIDDTYNASPLSMEAACHCLKDWPATGKRLLVAGDMLELGTEAERCHYELGACAAETGIDRLVAFGDQADQIANGALRAGMRPYKVAGFHDLEALLTVLDCWLSPGDVLLIKGSRGMRMERIVQWLKHYPQKPQNSPTAAAQRAVA